MNAVEKLLHFSKRHRHSWIKPLGYDTGIKVYNCVAREKVPLIVRDKNLVSWYTCGPTVYDSSHVGHASCFVKLDIIRRVLQRHFSLNLVTAMNVTDIDDKIVERARLSKVSVDEIARFYEKEFWEDMDLLNVSRPHVVMRVRESIPIIANFIAKLSSDGNTYKDAGGSTLFRIGDYGKLQNVNAEQLSDFTVWKAEKEPAWTIEGCGAGRPGWHTECSAMASAVFGSEIDIHAGGIDLKFPHHENEEVQSCAYHSKRQWVNYWLHTGHLLQNSIKMSKSLHNTLTIREMLNMCSGDVFRMMCLMSHYRKNMEFSEEYVRSAKTCLSNYKNFLINHNLITNNPYKPHIEVEVLNECVGQSVERITEALKDDFDTASCVKTIDNLISTINKMLHGSSEMRHMEEMTSLISAHNFIMTTLEMFGFDLSDTQTISKKDNENELINVLTTFRQNVRAIGLASKNPQLLTLCDAVRDDLNKMGVNVRDRKQIST